MAAGVGYELDGDDRITSVDERWDEFALENDAPELAGGAVLGRILWDFVQGEEPRLLLRGLLGRVRVQARDMMLPFRCDSPRERRFMTFEVVPGAGEGLRILTEIVRVEPRSRPAHFLEPSALRGDLFLRMCSWCNRVRGAADVWLEIEEALALEDLLSGAPLPRITHGICPRCAHLLEDGLAGEGDGNALGEWGSA
jgi:hypothetical protein